MVNSVSSGDKRAARDEQRKTMLRQMAQQVRTMKEITSDIGDGTTDESVKMLEERRQGKNRKRREKRRLRRRQDVDVLSQEDRLEHNEPNTLTTEGSQVHSEERSKGVATCKSLITETEEPRDIAHNGQMWTGSSTEIFHMCTESEPGAEQTRRHRGKSGGTRPFVPHGQTGMTRARSQCSTTTSRSWSQTCSQMTRGAAGSDAAITVGRTISLERLFSRWL